MHQQFRSRIYLIALRLRELLQGPVRDVTLVKLHFIGFFYLPPLCCAKLGFPGGSAVKHPPASAGDEGLIPGLGRSPGGGNATHSSILAWEIPWTEEPGGLQSMGSHMT